MEGIEIVNKDIDIKSWYLNKNPPVTISCMPELGRGNSFHPY